MLAGYGANVSRFAAIVIDYSPLPNFYRQQIWTWLRSLAAVFIQIFIGQFSFPAKICLHISATRQNSLQNFVDHSLWLHSKL